VFENRVLRTSGPKRDGVTAGRRKLHNEELNNLYFLPSIIRIMEYEMGCHVARIGKMIAYRLLVGKRPLGRPRRWVDDIKTDLVAKGMGEADWIGLG
jgi:hypothetical protein